MWRQKEEIRFQGKADVTYAQMAQASCSSPHLSMVFEKASPEAHKSIQSKVASRPQRYCL